MKNTEKADKMEHWLHSCPKRVIARVVESDTDLTNLGITAHIYKSGMLVVTTIEALQKLAEDK